MAISAERIGHRPRLLPASGGGRLALGLFALAVLLLIARLVLKPMSGLPVNYLMVLIPLALSGIAAAIAIMLERERSASVVLCAAAGLLAAVWLIAEALGGGTGPVTLNESNNGTTVTVPTGTTINLELPGNPTTGYSWEATIGNPAVLAEASAPVYKPTGTALGSGGTYTFQYTAKRAGRSDVTLVYHRSWETTPPLKTYRITVIVE